MVVMCIVAAKVRGGGEATSCRKLEGGEEEALLGEHLGALALEGHGVGRAIRL